MDDNTIGGGLNMIVKLVPICTGCGHVFKRFEWHRHREMILSDDGLYVIPKMWSFGSPECCPSCGESITGFWPSGRIDCKDGEMGTKTMTVVTGAEVDEGECWG